MLTRKRQDLKLTEITNYANVLIIQDVFDDVQVNVITMIVLLCKTSINIMLKSTKIQTGLSLI